MRAATSANISTDVPDLPLAARKRLTSAAEMRNGSAYRRLIQNLIISTGDTICRKAPEKWFDEELAEKL